MRIWRASRDLFFAGQMQWVGSQGVLLIGAAMLGPLAAGGIRAAQNIAGPINVMYQALENFMPMRAAQRYRAMGRAGLVSFLRKTTVIGTIGLGTVFAVISLCSTWLLTLAYGPSARKYAPVIVWQLIYFLFGFVWRQLIYFHRTVETTSSLVISNAVACVVTLVATPLTIAFFAEPGVMMAITFGEVACIIMLALRLREPHPAAIEREAEACTV
jgi:O-antigen/teichoic acid export membrane protein